MKFAKQLRLIIDQSPWGDNYINYKRLKKVISNLHLLGNEQPERSEDQIWVTFMKEFLRELRQSDNLISEKIRSFQCETDAVLTERKKLGKVVSSQPATPKAGGVEEPSVKTEPGEGESSEESGGLLRDLEPLSAFELPALKLGGTEETEPLPTFWDKELDEGEGVGAAEDTSTDEGDPELRDVVRTPQGKRRRLLSYHSDFGAHPSDAYFRLQNLQNELGQVQKFLHVNFTATTKITKKFDKIFSTKYQAKVLVPCKSRKVEQLTRLNKIEKQIQALLEQIGREPIPALDKKEMQEKFQHVKFLQEQVAMVMTLDLSTLPTSSITNLQLVLTHDGLAPTCIPVMVAKGKFKGPTLGITAALYGDELSGIPVINKVLRQISLEEMSGVIIGVPVLNPPGFARRQRVFCDGSDLDTKFPGKADGDAAESFCSGVMHKIVSKLTLLIEIQSSSLHSQNCFYARTDITDEYTKKVAFVLNPQVVVHGDPDPTSLRGASCAVGVPTVTFTIGGTEAKSVDRAVEGVENVLSFLKINNESVNIPAKVPVLCSESSWLYTHVGGVLRIRPSLGQWIKKGDLVATVNTVYGNLLCQFVAPEDGIVISRNADSACAPGDTLIQLGMVSPGDHSSPKG
eukprot:gb/GEZN01004413.1/.p1 GENE.gb/GEZN01004413.1/~~gb/GEZN01004413.1/.p1  ORF type:complete len:629 (-),score=118.40 gb/GEZN01004413.1/:13-1899(-)